MTCPGAHSLQAAGWRSKPVTVRPARNLAHSRFVHSLSGHLQVLPTSKRELYTHSPKNRTAMQYGCCCYYSRFPSEAADLGGAEVIWPAKKWDLRFTPLSQIKVGTKQPGGQCTCSLSSTQLSVTVSQLPAPRAGLQSSPFLLPPRTPGASQLALCHMSVPKGESW